MGIFYKSSSLLSVVQINTDRIYGTGWMSESLSRISLAGDASEQLSMGRFC